jgi:bifunctional non-homologous end joining protein LigD
VTGVKDGVEVAGVPLTHPDRVVFQRQGLTKERLARYYERIADVILGHLEDRPLTLVRCPEGAGSECFFVKHAGPWAPRSLRRVTIQEKTKTGEYVIVDSLTALIGLVQMGVLEIHTWNARARRLEHADRIVFDLDPGPGVEWRRVIAAATAIRERLEGLDLETFVKTTGGKGLHLVAPLVPRAGWEDCAELSRVVAQSLERDQPDEFVTDMAKSKRSGRILIDIGRNNRGSTSVAAYSTRARPSAPISMPVSWAQLSRVTGGDTFLLEDVEETVTKPGGADPWVGYGRVRQSVTKARLKSARQL